MARRSEVEPTGDDHRCRWIQCAEEKILQHFFKIILPKTINERKLRIPTKFVRKFGNKLADVANFIFPNGHAWKVGLRKEQNDIWFDDGWHDFVEQHSICDGYLLVFGYRGLSNFSVFIFDASACEIEYFGNDQGPICSEKCRSQNDVEVKDDNSIDVFHSRNLSLSSNSLKSKVCDVSANKGESSKELPPAKQNQGMKKRSRYVFSAASPNFKRHHETRKKGKMEQLAGSADIDAIGSSKKGKFTTNEMQDYSRSKVKSGANQLMLKCEEDMEIITNGMSELTKFSPETRRAVDAARKHKPKHPSFMVELRPYNCYNNVLYVPAEFSRMYLSEAPKYINLEVSDGREWRVRLLKNSRRSDLGEGVSAFFKGNNLKAGDVCVFELMTKKWVLKASIFRAVQYARPKN